MRAPTPKNGSSGNSPMPSRTALNSHVKWPWPHGTPTGWLSRQIDKTRTRAHPKPKQQHRHPRYPKPEVCLILRATLFSKHYIFVLVRLRLLPRALTMSSSVRALVSFALRSVLTAIAVKRPLNMWPRRQGTLVLPLECGGDCFASSMYSIIKSSWDRKTVGVVKTPTPAEDRRCSAQKRGRACTAAAVVVV